MGWTPGIPRAKLVVAERGPQLAAVLAVIALLTLAGAGWVFTHPPTTTVTDRTHEQTIESSVNTSAVVTGDSAMYEKGKRVENQPVYFTRTMPNLTLGVETTVPDDQSVRVDQRVELVMQATSDDEVFWERTHVLVDEEATTENGSVTTAATVNVPELLDRLEPVADEVGSAGSVSVAVELTTAYETDRYSGTLTRQRSLSLSGETYALDPFTVEQRESTTETSTTTVPRSSLTYVVPAAVGIVALPAAVVVFGLSRRRPEWGDLGSQIHRDRYAEWISEGSLSGPVADRGIEMASVEDLVDVAIDQDKRVIYDPTMDTHAVVDGPVVYYNGATVPRTAKTDRCD